MAPSLVPSVIASPLCSAHFSLAASLSAKALARVLFFPKDFAFRCPFQSVSTYHPLPGRSRSLTPMPSPSFLTLWGLVQLPLQEPANIPACCIALSPHAIQFGLQRDRQIHQQFDHC